MGDMAMEENSQNIRDENIHTLEDEDEITKREDDDREEFFGSKEKSEEAFRALMILTAGKSIISFFSFFSFFRFFSVFSSFYFFNYLFFKKSFCGICARIE